MYLITQGRPKGVREEDVYVCEYRVDKTARLFSKITRPRFPINTKSYCFDVFEQRLQPRRTLTVTAVGTYDLWCAFSALTLLVGRQEEHPARKKPE